MNRLALALSWILIHAALAGQPKIVEFDVPGYSSEGTSETIRVAFDRTVSQPVTVDLFEFHFFQHPQWAPTEDSWKHDRQMALAKEKLLDPTASRTTPGDPKVLAILANVSPKTIPLQTSDKKVFSVEWPAGHGRFYFRVRIADQPLSTVRTMRVHCRHVDMRGVEALKSQLDWVARAIGHGHLDPASRFLEQASQVFHQGHGLRFMLQHHGHDPTPLDHLFDQPSNGVDLESLERLVKGVRRAEESFRQVHSVRQGDALRIEISDRIGYPYGTSPEVQVYLLQAPPSSSQRPSAASPHDHRHAMGESIFSKEALAKGLLLEHTKGGFEGRVPESWKDPYLVVLYGWERRYAFGSPVN